MKCRTASALVVVPFAIGCLSLHAAERTTAKPDPPLPAVDISSCDVPHDVTANLPTEAYEQLPYFDAYSWHAFAALICAAKKDQNGVADPRAGKDGPGARVFETFKSSWEIFHNGTVGDWYSHENDHNPCGSDANDGALILTSTSKFSDVEAGEGTPLKPLPAQNGTYVHYLTQYNKISFDHILQVLRDQSTPIDFPIGSLNVKSAWVELKDLKASHFYHRPAWVKSFGGGRRCRKTEVALLGLHIVQKTPSRPHWIWSTFEHKDNAPDDTQECPPSGGPYTFNNKNCMKMPSSWPSENEATAPPQVLFNVLRTYNLINNLPDVGTKTTNTHYQGKFARRSKWRNYELVMTQWPTQNVPLPQAGNNDFMFPGTTARSAFANTVMETFFQQLPALSCLACHAKVAVESDFVWSLEVERPGTHDAALKLLQETLKDADFPPVAKPK